MKDAKQAMQGLATSPPSTRTDGTLLAKIERDTRKAAKNEDKQQQDALQSLSRVNHLIDDFKAKGIHASEELGESDDPTVAMQRAMHDLEQVSAALKTDTATSNTQKTILQMKAETRVMQNELAKAEQEFGGKGTANMNMPGGKGPADVAMHAGQPRNVHTGNPLIIVSEELGEGKQLGGAVGDLTDAKKALAAASTSVEQPPNTLAAEMDTARSQLQTLMNQEASVEKAEHADESAVHELINQLS